MFDKINEEIKSKAVEMLNNGENKAQAVADVVEMFNNANHEALINEVLTANEELQAGRKNAEQLGLKTVFTKEEKLFYEKLMQPKQSITANQIDIIPTTIIDNTLADVKTESDTLKLVNFAPAGVTKWLTGAHNSATAAWGELADSLTAEMTATISSLALDAYKLHVYCLIPKSIRKLAMPLVDKYFTAVLNEAIHDGAVNGFLNGTGVKMPIGIAYKLPSSTGAIEAKEVSTSITQLTDKGLAEVMVTLSKDGVRKIDKLYIVANPVDCYRYVYPALRYFNGQVYVPATSYPVEVIEEPMCTAGTKAFMTLAGVYTMGFSGVEVNEYREVKALDDADAIVAKLLGNGAPDDDSTAIAFDPTKLEEFVLPVNNKGK